MQWEEARHKEPLSCSLSIQLAQVRPVLMKQAGRTL